MFLHIYMVTDPLEFLTLTLTEFFLFFCRRTVAEAVTEEVFQQFRMYHEAGLPDFAFLRRVRSKGTHTLILLWFTVLLQGQGGHKKMSLTNSALEYESKCGGDGVGVSANR